MSKKVIIPLSDIDKFIANGDFAGVGFRYRLKSTDSEQVSEWSPMQIAELEDSSGANITLAQSNGYSSWDAFRSSNNQSAYPRTPGGASKSMQSQIDQVISQKIATTSTPHVPDQDLYRYSWTTPTNSNIKNFDIFTCWKIFAYQNQTATISSPSGAGPYTGTITLSGTGGTNTGVTIKTLIEKLGNSVVKLYAGPGTGAVTVGAINNLLTITSYTLLTNVFNISSDSTWTAGTLRNVSRTHGWTDFEYAGTTSNKNFEFNRKMTSNKVSATITAGDYLIRLTEGESCFEAGIVPGMIVQKISGDGEFATNAAITQVDYQNNTILVSELQEDSTIMSTTGTIGSITGTAGNYSATITGMSGVTPLVVDAKITATAGTGSLGKNNAIVTSQLSGTSIRIFSDYALTAGTITNIRVGINTSNSKAHTASGYIEFVAQSDTVSGATTDGTNSIEQYWYKPMYVQAMLNASTSKRSNIGNTHPYKYALLSISEAQSTFFDVYGTISARTTSAPFTATLSGMSLQYADGVNYVGATLYGLSSPLPTSTVSLGVGEVKIADYTDAVSLKLSSTAAMNLGVVTSLRL